MVYMEEVERDWIGMGQKKRNCNNVLGNYLVHSALVSSWWPSKSKYIFFFFSIESR